MRKRAKLRKSPKALITKDIKETFYPVPLMAGSIVTSLEILAIEMGDRGSKSVIPICKQIRYKFSDYCKRATSRRFFHYINLNDKTLFLV
jgi:hypothetical protein